MSTARGLMTLIAGTRLGPYEILSPLGVGGMGEVYRATDSRLGREVAVKVVSKRLTGDPGALARFQREARVVASLSHPNVVALHDVGAEDGVAFAVMELLEGEPLDRHIGSQGIPWTQAVDIAISIADAVACAHDRGVVHRDLKPANVFVTRGGLVKVLDFGLARQDPVPADPQMPNVSGETQPGIVLGTVGYMSPEQVRGEPAEPRSDIFSLGCVLYEMLSGRRPFEGETAPEVQAAILRDEPGSVAELNSKVPRAVSVLVQRCLEKRPEQRFQSAGDLAFALRQCREASEPRSVERPAREPLNPSEGESTDIEQNGSAKPTLASTPQRFVAGSVAALVVLVHAALQRSSKRQVSYWIAATCVLAVMAASLALYRARLPRPATSPVRLFLPPLEHAVYPSFNQVQSSPIVSPDGRYVAIVAHENGGLDHIWVHFLDGVTARALPGTESAFGWAPFWSPDSRSLAFFAAGKLKRVDLAGGAPQVLADAPDPRGGAWSEAGVIVFAPTAEGPLSRVSASGGPVTTVMPLRPPENGQRFPALLPDGRHFFYLSRDSPSFSHSGTNIASLDSTEVIPLLPPQKTFVNVAYSNAGYLLFARARTLYAQKFDPYRRRLSGDPIVVAEHVISDRGPGAMFSISNNDVLVYRQEASTVMSQLVWFDRTGKRLGEVGVSAANQDTPTLSPDGTHVAVRRGLEPSGQDDIWILDVATGTPSRFTFDSGNFAPVWSPDGRSLAFGSQHSERAGVVNGVFRKASSGVGDVDTLVRGRLSTDPTDWSRDGKFIIYDDQDPTTGTDIWALPLSGGRTPILLVRTPGTDRFGQLSPDGRWLAYASTMSGRFEVYVQPFPTGSGKWQVSTNGGTQPRWRRDGKELFYVTSRGELMAVTVIATGESIQTGVQTPLFTIPQTFSQTDFTYDVSADGHRFLVNPVISDTSQPIVVVLNWTAALNR